ncbi:VOC family protein [Lactococcus muris]|uniref:VOC family protein n=1 Tax=Lactococcus muris TaxID=2941330 RepID=A0ABV4D5D2_9LACT|nr:MULTISPECIES: VOC family protein [Lactococcus]MBL3716250.1 ring-cleaving dioxygenase [Lactococcus garvieae]
MKLHHISLLTADFERNFHFYVDILGLRLVKNSINQGNIYMRHVYYGDFRGTPGTVVTFFPDRRFDLEREEGTSYLSGIQFKIPKGAMDFWTSRFKKFGLDYQRGDYSLEVKDFDDVLLEFIEEGEPNREGRINALSDVPAAYQITGLWGSRLYSSNLEATRLFFQQMVGSETGIQLLASQAKAPSRVWGRGSIDHLAFAVASSKDLDEIWEKALTFGYERELYADRGYFQSVYLREPGGVRIEFATLTPGFTLDESIQDLGSGFALPPRYEERRQELLRYYHKQGVHFEKKKEQDHEN